MGKPICGDPECGASTGICGFITHGKGDLDFNGYWEFPCDVCEKADGRHEDDFAKDTMIKLTLEEDAYLHSLRILLEEIPWVGDGKHEERRVKLDLNRLGLEAPLDWSERRHLAMHLDKHNMLLERDEVDIEIYWAVQYLVKP